MNNIWTILKRELGSYFNSAIAYIYLIVFVAINNGLFMTRFFLVGKADMRSFFDLLPMTLLVFIPVLSMRLWAEDKKENTFELLMTFPMKPAELVVGKFLAGLIFTLVPYKIISLYQPFYPAYLPIFIWVLAFLTLLLISAIDYRHQIIPDSLNIFMALLGVAMIFIHSSLGDFGLKNGMIGGSFLGSYALMFFIGNSLLVNMLAGAAFGALFIGLIYLLTRGNGIGFGDVKLAAAAGLLIGWPDIALSLLLAFIVGAIVGGGLMLFKRKTIHDAVPFGPFIAVGITIVFFLGYDIVNAYFRLFSLA